MKISILVFLLVMCLGQANAQKQEQALIDSLQTELTQAKEDTNKVNLMINYSRNTVSLDFPGAIDYAYKAEALSKKIRWKSGQLNAMETILLLQAISGNYSQSIETGLKIVSLSKKWNDTMMLARAYVRIGDGFRALSNFTQAKFYLMKAIEINIPSVKSKALTSFAEMSLEENDTIQFKKYYKEADDLMKRENDHAGQAGLLLIQGRYLSIKNSMAEAIESLKKALAIYKTMGEVRFEAYTLANIGSTYTKIKNKDSAYHYVVEAIRIAEKYKLKKEKIDAFHAKFYSENTFGDYKSALQSLLIVDSLKEFFFGSNNNILTNGLQLKFEQEKQNMIIKEEIKNQRRLIFFSLSFATLVLLFLIISYRQGKRIKKQKLEADYLRKETETLLLNILPEDVAEELKTKGRAEARQFDEVTVLFTDFVHFTQASEKLTPRELVQELNECFTAFDKIIEQNGLEKIKTIGDSYMAVCGLPLPQPGHAQKTVQAALEIRDFMLKRAGQENTFNIRIGINSGSVVAGIVGVKKFAYDIWGDTVNTAARMESNGQPGRVNISETTYRLVKDDFTCTHRGKISAKGKGEVDMYFVE